MPVLDDVSKFVPNSISKFVLEGGRFEGKLVFFNPINSRNRKTHNFDKHKKNNFKK